MGRSNAVDKLTGDDRNADIVATPARVRDSRRSCPDCPPQLGCDPYGEIPPAICATTDERAAHKISRAFTVADFRVPACYLRMIVGQASATSLLARSGLSISLVDSEEEFLPTVTFVDLCLEHIRTARSEALGHSPSTIPFGTFSLLIAAVAQGRNFGEALRRCADAMRILRPDMLVKLGRSRTSIQVSVTAREAVSADAEIGLEFFVLALHCAFRWLTGERLRPVKARAHAVQAGLEQTMLRVLCCPTLRRGTGVTLHYALGDTAKPVRSLKYENWGAHELPEFLRLLQEAAHEINDAQTSAPAPVVARVLQLIEMGHRSECAIAARIGMSSTSLRRHLAEGGTSYRAILSNAQRDLVTSLLHTDKTLDAIAAEAGFSDARSLSRAYLRWFGITPAQYRRQSGNGSAPLASGVANDRGRICPVEIGRNGRRQHQ